MEQGTGYLHNRRLHLDHLANWQCYPDRLNSWRNLGFWHGKNRGEYAKTISLGQNNGGLGLCEGLWARIETKNLVSWGMGGESVGFCMTLGPAGWQFLSIHAKGRPRQVRRSGMLVWRWPRLSSG